VPERGRGEKAEERGRVGGRSRPEQNGRRRWFLKRGGEGHSLHEEKHEYVMGRA